ncbi:secreted RxLR effector protein 161-like [Nicotiana tabacum]|uniref:Secreted RxLR effector protein 161-like n=1 Tax=Nicotiana tabacum TaxID=4097 RepID=A0AC58RQ55_TOBAC
MVGSDCMIIYLYVDDMLIFGPNVDIVNKTKNLLSSKFEMKDLEEVDPHYIEKILKRFDCFDVAPVRTPYDPSIHLRKNKESSVSQTEYAKIIDSVIFLMNYTRLDIAYVVSRLSRYTHNPNSEHQNVLHRLLRYLKVTMDWCLYFNKFLAVLEGFCDANWVTNNDEVISTSSYVFTLGVGPISWKSSKQTCIARSTMESEFISLELAGQETEWLRKLLADVLLWRR